MGPDKLESGKCDGLGHLDDDDLRLVTGGANDSKNLVLCEGFYMTKQTCNQLIKSQEAVLDFSF
jgi:hypothetical protein